MTNDIAGKALYPLSDLVEAAEFPLSAVIAAQQYGAIFKRFYYSDIDAYVEDDKLYTDVELLYQGILALPIPGLDGFQLIFNSPIPGWTRLRASFVLGDNPAFMIHGASIVLRVPQSILQDVAGAAGAQISVATDILISSARLSFVNIAGATMAPARVLGTDVVVQATGLRPIVADTNDDTALPAIQGIEFDVLSVQVPLAFLKLADQGVFTCEIIAARIDAGGFSGAAQIEAAELPAVIAGQYLALPFEFRRFGLDIEQNQINAFFIGIAIRLPALEEPDAANWLTLNLNLDRNSQALSATLEAPLVLGLGRPDFKVTIETLALSGQHNDDGFTAQGTASGELTLPNAAIALESAQMDFAHSKSQTRLGVQINGLVLGSLGAVDTARLVVVTANDEAANTSGLESVTLETALHWQDIRDRIALAQLPFEFPLPPDDATISVYFDWRQDGKIEMRLAAALSDLDSLWGFIPEAFRPEVRDARFSLAILYASAADLENASTSDTFDGEISVEMELRLPEFPAVPGAELFDVDREQWIKASLRGGVRSVNGANEGYMEMAIADAPAVKVNFPGLPQAEPPIQIKMNKVDFDLKAQPGADSLTGHLALDGDFLLRPINPAETNLPVPPAMAAHMEKLFKAAGLSDFGGTANFDLKFKGDKAAMDLSIAFDQAKMELDLFDVLAGVTRGMSPPQGINGPANSIDLDIDVDIRLREIKIQFGSIEDSPTTDQSHFGFELALDGTFAGVQVDGFFFKLSSQEFSFGFASLAVPIALPHFPISLNDLNQLKDGNGAWDYEILWLQDREPQLASSIRQLKNEIEALKGQLTTATGDTEASLSAGLRAKRKSLFENSARKFLIDSIFAVHQVVGPSNRSAYQTLVEAYMALMDATLHQFAFDTKLDFVLRDVRFVLPFQNPTDIRVEGGAQLAGFKPDDPLAPLGDLVFKVGLSAEYIYFNVEGGDPIPLPIFGEYENAAGEKEAKVSLRLNHARIGYGYSKNALVVALAGELKIARPLADDLNTADVIGIGVRLPERSRLGFKLDLIPIVLGEVDFLLPLFEFDIDLRKEYSPGIADSATCAPFWDGLQIIAPNIIRQDFKRLRFAPFFGSLLAPNYNTSFDLMLGDAHNGLTYVCNEYLVILPTSLSTTIPLLTDGTPFFDNLCINARLAGFGVNFDLQRPFPSMSPLALFEIFGLIADPMLPIDPDGALANTIRATIQNARITLPPAVVRMFPEHGTVLTREVNYTINLGTLITIAQAIAGPVGQILNQAQATTGAIGSVLENIKNQPPDLSPAALLALLPPELRRFDLHGSFVGFDATAGFVLLTPDEAAQAFAQRYKPTAVRKPRLVVDERFDDPALSGWDVLPPRGRNTWHAEGGALRQSGRSDVASHALYQNQYDDVSFTAVLAAEGENAIGVVFGFQDEKNYYRFEMNPAAKTWELAKVRNARATVLRQLPQETQLRRSYSVTVKSDGGSVLPPGGPFRTGVRLVIGVDGRDAFDLYDSSTPFKDGRLGVTCQAGAQARFDGVRIHRLGAPQRPLPGEYPDPAWLTSFQPNFSKPAAPLYDPTAAANSLLKSAPFDAFDAATLAALPVPSTSASGVLVGAEVKVLDDQRFGFLGYLFTDGKFSLVSALDVKPLRLSVAGISVELPLEIQGRLMLEGRAQGAESYAKLRAQVWGAWQPLLGVVEVNAGSKSTPIELTLTSNGRFALSGSGGVKLFGGAAVLNGTVDISHRHCFINGAFEYKPDFQIGNQRVVDLSLTSTGRIGPGVAFELSGAGTLKILGKSFSHVSGTVSDKGVELEARIDGAAWNWNGIDIKQCTLALKGKIDLSKPGAPAFLLEGDAKARLFGAAASKARAEISGRGGIRAEAGEITQFIEGSLYWQGREWLGGRLELGTQHISVQGRTAFALDLTPAELPTGIQLANLFFRIDLAGGFQLTKTGGLEACNLDVDWSLAVKMPGIEQQFPIAMQKKRFSYAAGQNSPQEIDLLPLLNIDGALFLPLDKLTLPIPVVSADQYTQYYWYWDSIAQSSQLTYSKVSIADSGSSSDPRFPTAVGQTGDLNIAQRIASAFGLGNPPVSVNVPTYGVTGWKYIKFADEDIDLPAIKAPRVAAFVPASVPANQKFELFKLPMHFAASFADGANMLKPLKFSLMLTWKEGKLGLTVVGGNNKKFKAFEQMFG